MHKTLLVTLERMNKNHKFIKRLVLTNLHKFVTHIKMLLYGSYISEPENLVGIKFDGLAVYLCNHQIIIRQYFKSANNTKFFL